MSNAFKNIEEFNKGGQDLEVDIVPLSAFGETKIPNPVSFQIGDSRAIISLEDFCMMCHIYLVHGGLAGWESSGGIPEPVQKVLEAAAKRIGR
jgi:hypothetical protein